MVIVQFALVCVCFREARTCTQKHQGHIIRKKIKLHSIRRVANAEPKTEHSYSRKSEKTFFLFGMCVGVFFFRRQTNKSESVLSVIFFFFASVE